MKTKEIALGGIWSALFAVVIILTNFIPGFELTIILMTPIALYILSEKSNFRTVLIFCVAIIFISLLINYLITIIYLVPSLIIGIGYILLFKHCKDIVFITFLMGFIHAILLFSTIKLVDFIFASDIISYIKSILMLSDAQLNDSGLLLLLICGMSESILTSIVFYYEYNRFHRCNIVIIPTKFLFFLNLTSFILAIILPAKIALPLIFIFILCLLTNIFFAFTHAKKYLKHLFCCQLLSFILMIILLTILKEQIKLWAYAVLGIPALAYLFFYLFLIERKNGKIMEEEELRI